MELTGEQLREVKKQFLQGKSIESILKNDFADAKLFVIRGYDQNFDEEYIWDVFFEKKEAEDCLKKITANKNIVGGQYTSKEVDLDFPDLFYETEATLDEIETKYSFDEIGLVLLHNCIEDKLRRD